MQSLALAIFQLLMLFTPSKWDTETRDERAGRMLVLSYAIAQESSGVTEAAKAIVQAHEESHFDQAVHAGHCRPGTCDHNERTGEFMALGPWQLHRNALNSVDWDAMQGDSPLATVLQARWAIRSLRRCKGLEESFQAQGGGRCESGPRGVDRARKTDQVVEWLRAIRVGKTVTVTW